MWLRGTSEGDQGHPLEVLVKHKNSLAPVLIENGFLCSTRVEQIHHHPTAERPSLQWFSSQDCSVTHLVLECRCGSNHSRVRCIHIPHKQDQKTFLYPSTADSVTMVSLAGFQTLLAGDGATPFQAIRRDAAGFQSALWFLTKPRLGSRRRPFIRTINSNQNPFRSLHARQPWPVCTPRPSSP